MLFRNITGVYLLLFSQPQMLAIRTTTRAQQRLALHLNEERAIKALICCFGVFFV